MGGDTTPEVDMGVDQLQKGKGRTVSIVTRAGSIPVQEGYCPA